MTTRQTTGEPPTIAGVSLSQMVLEEREDYDTGTGPAQDDDLTFTGNCYTLTPPEPDGDPE